MIVIALALGAFALSLLAGAAANEREGDPYGCILALGLALLGLAYLIA